MDKIDNSDKVVAQIVKKVSALTVDDVALYLQENGVTIGSLCYKLKQLLDAKTIGRDDLGRPMKVDDNNVQLKAMMAGYELLKLVGNKQIVGVATVTHQMAPGDIDRLEAIAHELHGLETRLVNDSIQQGQVIDV